MGQENQEDNPAMEECYTMLVSDDSEYGPIDTVLTRRDGPQVEPVCCDVNSSDAVDERYSHPS